MTVMGKACGNVGCKNTDNSEMKLLKSAADDRVIVLCLDCAARATFGEGAKRYSEVKDYYPDTVENKPFLDDGDADWA
jgi:hypothetical protein